MGKALIVVFTSIILSAGTAWPQTYHPVTTGSFEVFTEPNHVPGDCHVSPKPDYCKAEIVVNKKNMKGITIVDCRSPFANCPSGFIDSAVNKWNQFRAGDGYVHVSYTYADASGKTVTSDGWIESLNFQSDVNPETKYIVHFEAEATDPVCVKCAAKAEEQGILGRLRNDVNNIISSTPNKFQPAIYCDDLSGCSSRAKKETYGDARFGIELKREKAPEGTPFSAKSKGGYNGAGKVTKGKPDELCHITFTGGCGNDKVAKLDKLDWLAGTLREDYSSSLCRAAVDEFNQECAPWKDIKSLEERREKVMRWTESAVNSFHQTIEGVHVYPGVKGLGWNNQPVYKRAPELEPGLAQCVLRRENPDYLPNKLNYTECGDLEKFKGRKSKLMSFAWGLPQITPVTSADLGGGKQYDGYCGDFANYWKSTAKERKADANREGRPFEECPVPATSGDTVSRDPDAIARKMSESPELQIAIMVKTFNHRLLRARAMIEYERKRFEEHVEAEKKWAEKKHKVWKPKKGEREPELTRDAIVKKALDLWFTTHDRRDIDSVFACDACMMKSKGDRCCLQKARANVDLAGKCGGR